MVTSKESYGASQETAPESCGSAAAWWEWDLETDALNFLDGAKHFGAFPTIDLPSRASDWATVTHKDDIPELTKALTACRDGRSEEFFCEHRVLAPNGEWRWILNTGRAMRPGSGHTLPMMMSGVTVDVSIGQRRDELLLRNAQMLSAVKQSIVCTDLSGIVNYWSEGAAELYGWSAEEMLGKAFYSRMPTDEMREHAKFRMRTAEKQGEYRHERADYRKDGTQIFVESRVFALRDVAGKVVGVIGTAYDITARKKAEQERLQLERQLLQTQKQETIGTLAGGVAHEFNNLLASIMGNTELAMQAAGKEGPSLEYLEAAMESSRRARDLVQRILSFSRPGSHQNHACSLSQITENSIKLIRATLPATVEIEFAPQPGLPAVIADPDQMQQVLMNLAANAGYALRNRRGHLRFELSRFVATAPIPCPPDVIASGTYVRLVVSDDGPGIDPVHLPRIFDPFYTTKPVGEGSGLGLSIVQSIVKGHGGGIDVQSTAGAGTRFTIYMPASKEGAPRPEIPATQVPHKPMKRGSGQRIVIIDDDVSVGRVMQIALRRLGYEVSLYDAADQFYGEFSANPFKVDLLLTDQTMARMTGLGLAKLLRSEKHAFPIVVASGFSFELSEESAASIGGVTLIGKPFEISTLAEVLHGILEGQRGPLVPSDGPVLDGAR